jgi:glycogen debranching enzyme
MTLVPLKSNACFAMLDGNGFCNPAMPRVAGFFLHDTRHLSHYTWDLPGFDLVHSTATLQGITQFWSRFDDHAQVMLIRRELVLLPGGFTDSVFVQNESLVSQILTLDLHLDADFVDSFELRGRVRGIGRNAVTRDGTGKFAYIAQDGVRSETLVVVDGITPGSQIVLAPGAGHQVSVAATFTSDLAPPGQQPQLEWTEKARDFRKAASPVVSQSFADIEGLATTSAQGIYIAAGVPNFVTPFGRDGLITAWFLLEAAPSVAEGTLRLLAAHQGRGHDPARAEEPGKIAHELRFGELARTGDVPFGRYFGTTDATALFLIVLRDHALATGDRSLVKELAAPLDAAIGWIEAQQDDRGLVRYPASRIGRGLLNTSWKDSDDSVSYADGTLATGRIAVVEIQGYVAAALEAAGDMLGWLSGPAPRVTELRAKAAALCETIDRLFWNASLGLHVIAVDEDGGQCDIATSNPGHLLWSGSLSADRAADVAERLMQADIWSGWGLRTLSTAAKRYQPLSYHNGSVWPHDTGLFAAGLQRYGLNQQAHEVVQALRDTAALQPGFQLPELFAGYQRDGDIPPLAYVESCRPQAWAAAALIWAEVALDWRHKSIIA